MYPFKTWTDKAERHVYIWKGLKIPYCTLGKGPPIVLVHGLGLSFEEWEKNIKTLACYGKIYALDLPGFGHADKPDQILSCRELAEAALDWAQGIGLEPGIWLGHSLGGEIALWAAALKPEQIIGLVLASSTGLPPRRRLPRRILGLVMDGTREAPGYMIRLLVSYLQAGPLRVLQTIQISDADPLLKLTSRINMPVLVMHGRRDPIISLRESRMTARRLLQGRFCLLEASHAMLYSTADQFNAKLAEFLQERLGPPRQPQTDQNLNQARHSLQDPGALI